MTLEAQISDLSPPRSHRHAAGWLTRINRTLARTGMYVAMRSIAPFYGALFLALLLVTYVPAFSLWLPRLLTN